jgi:hypothetical protein
MCNLVLCIVDDAEVSLDLKFEGCYNINPGPNVAYGGSTSVNADSLLGDFKDKVKKARPFDIRVRVTGAFGGNVTGGVARINGIPILTYGGAWSSFSTPQSLLGRSPFIQPQSAGIAELVRVLLLPPPRPPVVLSSTGTLTGGGVPPVPAGLGLCIEVYTQADAVAIES